MPDFHCSELGNDPNNLLSLNAETDSRYRLQAMESGARRSTTATRVRSARCVRRILSSYSNRITLINLVKCKKVARNERKQFQHGKLEKTHWYFNVDKCEYIKITYTFLGALQRWVFVKYNTHRLSLDLNRAPSYARTLSSVRESLSSNSLQINRYHYIFIYQILHCKSLCDYNGIFINNNNLKFCSCTFMEKRWLLIFASVTTAIKW